MERKVFKYFVEADWEKDKQGFFKGVNPEKFPFSCPPEFGGPDGFLSPEEIFVAASATCVMATFINTASKKRLDFVSYKSSAEGVMEHNGCCYEIKTIYLRPTIIIKDGSQRELCMALLKDAHETCPVGKSVKTNVVLEPNILTEQA